MLANFWKWIQDGWRREGDRLDRGRIDKAMRDHEEAEREKASPNADLPPGRSNTDWTYIPPP